MAEALAVEMKNMTFAYGAEPVLVDVNMTIFEREFVSIVGPNGGGKTTMLKLMLGLLRPTTGTVRIFGRPPEQSRSNVGYVSQHLYADLKFPANVLDVVLMGRLGNGRGFGPYSAEDKKAARRAIESVGLENLAMRPFSDLSGGQRQRVLIARAVVSDPRLLLLDEPTSSLDADVENDIYELLKAMNAKITLVLVSHDIWFVSQFVNRVACVRREVQIHETGEVDAASISQVCGLGMKVVRHDHGWHEGEGA